MVSGAGGSHSQIIGYRSNSEADLVSDATLCGEYAEATMTTTYPGSVTMANTEPLDLIIGDPGASEDGSWTVTLEFNLVNYPTITYSQTFEIHACEGLSSLLQNTDGSHIYEYTVGDPTLLIPIPITYLDTLCTNPATINAPTHSGPVNLIVVNGLNYEISITDPATFTSYASVDGEITIVTISDN